MMRTTIVFACVIALAGASSAVDAAVIAYWNQNSNDLPSGGFGFTPSSFPQPADFGNGTLELANFDETTSGADDAYSFIPSFAGTGDNALFGDPSGGSLSPQGGTDDGSGGLTNNGMEILVNVDTSGFSDVGISWAQRGTGTGFDSREFAYSSDGGGSFTPVAFTGDTGTLSSSWDVVSPDLSGVAALSDNPNVVFRLTLDGATGGTGNNRFDNIVVEGVPEPGSVVLAVLAGLALAAVGRRASR